MFATHVLPNSQLFSVAGNVAVVVRRCGVDVDNQGNPVCTKPNCRNDWILMNAETLLGVMRGVQIEISYPTRTFYYIGVKEKPRHIGLPLVQMIAESYYITNMAEYVPKTWVERLELLEYCENVVLAFRSSEDIATISLVGVSVDGYNLAVSGGSLVATNVQLSGWLESRGGVSA